MTGALISRDFQALDDDEVVVIDVWNPNHPNSPIVLLNGQRPYRPVCRTTVLSASHFAYIFGDHGQ